MKALMLSLAMTAMLLPMTSFAQQTSDDFFRVDDAFNDNRAVAIALTGNLANDDFGAPLGSGLLILTAAGAGYAISRRKRSFRKGSALVLAALMLMGMTACKKKVAEPITPATGNQVAITLNVGGGAKAEVDPPHVNFVENDKILVAHDGKYVGTLTYTEYETGKFHFQGNIDATVATPRQKLYFYFLGNKQNDASLEAGTTTSCTVNISDQTNYPTLPVISFSASDEDYEGAGTYNAKLHNKCSLIKFNVTTPSNSPICITGMNNKVTVDFSEAANDGENNGFSYDKVGDGIIKLKGGSGSPAEKWAIVLPQDELAAGSAGSIYAQNGTYTTFTGTRPTIHAIEANGYYHEGGDVISMTVNTATNIIDLGDVTVNTEIATGKTLIGTLASNVMISIADGATVTLHNVTINGVNENGYKWAGLNCLGDATIILKDGSTNNVKGFYEDYPGIHVPAENTLTIKGETLGTGSLNASSNTDETASGAGIGGGWNLACGNIEIQSGVITANGSVSAAGIGSNNKACGTITISGGTVTATGGSNAAGIGSGCDGSCGIITISGGTVASTGGNSGAGIGTGVRGRCNDGITIANTVTKVTATKGDGSTYSIGAGYNGSCGTVTIGGVTGAISISPYTYIPGAISGTFSVSSTKQVYFSQGNLKYSAGTWSFHTNQYDRCFTSERDVSSDYDASGTFDLFGWGTSGYNHGANASNPYSTSTTYWDYYAYGSATANLYDGNGKADWGYNAISNGGNAVNQWRTLTTAEWVYLFNNHTKGWSTVNGVNGYVIRPDGVSTAVASSYTALEWATQEADGSVFLPAAGYRNATSLDDVGPSGTTGRVPTTCPCLTTCTTSSSTRAV